jgi:hypothetical protein
MSPVVKRIGKVVGLGMIAKALPEPEKLVWMAARVCVAERKREERRKIADKRKAH